MCGECTESGSVLPFVEAEASGQPMIPDNVGIDFCLQEVFDVEKGINESLQFAQNDLAEEAMQNGEDFKLYYLYGPEARGAIVSGKIQQDIDSIVSKRVVFCRLLDVLIEQGSASDRAWGVARTLDQHQHLLQRGAFLDSRFPPSQRGPCSGELDQALSWQM